MGDGREHFSMLTKGQFGDLDPMACDFLFELLSCIIGEVLLSEYARISSLVFSTTIKWSSELETMYM